MNLLRSVYVALVITFVFVSSCIGTTYYVDYLDGADTNTGTTPLTPFKHCPGCDDATDRADLNLSAGDKIIFKGGVKYRGQASSSYLSTVQSGTSGTPGEPIIYDGNTAGDFGVGRAIIDGSTEAVGWTRCTSADDADGNPLWADIWYADIAGPFVPSAALFFQDDQLLVLAQDPNVNSPFFPDDLTTFHQIDRDFTDTTVTDPTVFNQADADYWTDAYLRLYGNPNMVYLSRITAYDPATGTVTFSPTIRPYSSGSSQYAIVNHQYCLDSPGEYVVSPDASYGGKNRVWLLPLDAADPNSVEISYAVRRTGLHIKGVTDVTVQGFIIQKHTAGKGVYRQGNGLLSFSGCDQVTIRDNIVRWNYSAENNSAVRFYGTGGNVCDDLLIEENEIYENPHNSGMNVTMLRGKVRNNYLRANGGTAIDFYGCVDSEMIGNLVEDHDGVHANGLTLYLSCNNCLVAYNKVRNANCALTTQASTNITIAYNELHSPGAVYTSADWSGCDGLYFYNNVIMNPDNPGAGMTIGSTTVNVVVRNNIIDGSDALYDGHTSENNIYTSLSWTQRNRPLGLGEFTADADDLFVDAAALDYRLKEGCAAIDAGVAIASLPLAADIRGIAIPQGAGVDIGANEYSNEIPGDANGDGTVNLDDFIILKQNYGTSSGATWSMGDFNHDGVVNLDDFIILKQNYGTTAAP